MQSMTRCNPIDCSPPGTSVHWILQARILERVTMPFFKGSSRQRDLTHISHVSCIGRHVLYHSVSQSCLTPWEPMDCSMPGFCVHHQLPELAQTHVHRVGGAIQHLILCHPLFLLPSIFPNIRVFSNESVLRIRWPKHWSFGFSISPSNEYSGLISFRIDWFDLLAVHGTLKSLLQHHSTKASVLQHSAFFMA